MCGVCALYRALDLVYYHAEFPIDGHIVCKLIVDEIFAVLCPAGNRMDFSLGLVAW